MVTSEATPRPRRARGLARILRRLVLVFVLLTVVPVLLLRWVPAVTSAFMIQRFVAALLEGEDPRIRHHWVGWDDISPAMRLAVVASEDQKFPAHWGFDLQSIADAASDSRKARGSRGASTITQQVAKNLFLWPGRSWVRKGMEAYFTVWIELLWPKRRILEMYLNVAQFGDKTFGVGGAANYFFFTTPDRLRRHDAALLAAVLPNPNRFRPDRPSPYTQRRAEWIERQMGRLGADHLAGLEPRRKARRASR
jgi:monofunctional biosynthetic peptidoglycan transglycosylase